MVLFCPQAQKMAHGTSKSDFLQAIEYKQLEVGESS
jgi:hypothetical protein